MHKSLIVILLPLLGIVCGAQTPPTATEAFNLRIRCKQMADEKAAALAQPLELSVADGASLGISAADVARLNDETRPEVVASWASSKYDAKNNRCYVRIYKHTRRKSQFDYEVHQAYDAQVDDLLASAVINNANGNKHGQIWDQSSRALPLEQGEADRSKAAAPTEARLGNPD